MSPITIPPLSEDLESVLIDADTIQRKVSDLSRRISEDYKDSDGLVVVSVLKGAFMFTADLCRQLSVPHTVDFIALSSYGNRDYSSGNVRLIMDVRENLADKDVLIVEDILDSGHTLSYLVRNFTARQPSSLKTAALVSKPDRLLTDVKLDYLGFEIPDVWVVGYGLDYAEQHRTLPYIAVMNRT